MQDLIKNSVSKYYSLGESDTLEYFKPIDDPITKSPIPPFFQV